MEPTNNNDVTNNSYYHPQLHQVQQIPSNGLVSTATNNNTNTTSNTMVYPHNSVPSAVSAPLDQSVKRKRGRPRKYGTPEQAAAAKRLSAASSLSPRNKRDAASGSSNASSSYSAKKSQLSALGNLGQSFSPHIITVATGEDVGQKITMFMNNCTREICIMSASGSVSNASLRQPATSGGSVTYEGRFDILSMSGSYIRTEHGARTGGLSVCLSSSDGQIIGGGVGGPLTAAGPIQVIVGTFVMDSKKDAKGADPAPGKLPSPIGGASISNLSFRSPTDSPHHQMGSGNVNPFMSQHRNMQQMTPPHSMEWRVGNTGFGMHQSPENGDYDHITD